MSSSLNELIEPETTSEIDRMRHSCAHVMAHAVNRLWPGARFGIGPTIENGFYYDISIDGQITPEDLPRIEKEMEKIIRERNEFVRKEHPVAEAIRVFRDMKQPFKVEIVENLRDQTSATSVSTYQEGDFLDLCRGPHVKNSSEIGPFKLLSVAGAYWRGNEKNPQLQRIYGTCFKTKEELKEHLHLLEEAKKRDHRKLGRELDLFQLHPFAPGMPFFHPKGATVYRLLVDYIRELYRVYGYDEVITPQIMDVSFWKTSGHYDNYRDNMYFTEIDEREFAVKPMNCPGHTQIYAATKRSYRDLPIRLADFGRLHRYERSGVIAGITRVRSFCQDDAHIFCMPDQIEAEIDGVISMILKTHSLFGFTDTEIHLATRPEKRVGDDEVWDKAESALKRVLDKLGKSYIVHEGDATFYGPKIDFYVSDAIKRKWQLSTIQLDFNLPERFDLKFTGTDNSNHRPVMIHRAVLGSLERFMGVLIEHTGGAFPFWLAPLQARIVPIGPAHVEYAISFARRLKELRYRVDVDSRNESMGLKTREAQMQKIPFTLVCGDREMQAGLFAVRKYGEKESAATPQEGILSTFQELADVPRRAVHGAG